MYHISDLKKYNRCPRILHLEKQGERVAFQRMVRLDDEVTALAAKKLGVTESFIGERGDDPNRALEALKQYEWLVKARFEYGGLRIKVPFLHRSSNGRFDLYFLFIGLFPHNDDMQFYCDTVWVLQHLKIRINDIYMIHLNHEYVRGDALEPEKLFIVTDYFYNRHNNPGKNVKEAIGASMKDVSLQIEAVRRCEGGPIPDPVRMPRCTGRQKCRYYQVCFPDEMVMPDNSILTLIASQHRHQMSREGIQYLRDADISRIEGSRQQYAQIMADKQGGLFFDALAVKSWLKQVKYPVTFLDFEWECFAIPPYKGMKPYDVLLFEYSIHILEADGKVRHEVFLSTHDDREDLARSLIRDIPSEGSIIAYNAESAEMIRIRELAALFPEMADELLPMNDRMVDLQIPFVSGLVYDVRMKGSWTLKQIMSLLEENSYRDLDIHQGMEAVFEWRHLDREEQNVDRERIIEDLKAYCSMDSYSTLAVFRWLESMVS